jgi:glutamyl-tRNA synthetase
MNKIVRTRFAPSPTGGLHLGGVRTALFSYLYAKKYNGKFVLRVEDTDQNRYVEGAEKYIIDCLTWCGILPDEGPDELGGEFSPYRQSERKPMYKQYAMQLVASGNAYYAFDTTQELEQMRESLKSIDNPSPQYDAHSRMKMQNSIALPKATVDELLAQNTPYVIRIKMPKDETIIFQDMIRGEIKNESNLIDDKVLLKADGMPTYHLAVVVDDYTMQITHAFRGEEWLPSAPVHVLLWKYLGWENDMPQWAHLPLILKPDGNGKLSKRDGERLGFPVFAMNWTDPNSNENIKGFKEIGFLPEAFINMLALLGWHSGEEKEIFEKQELIQAFSIERVHKGGAKFDYEKAKWFNHHWIMNQTSETLLTSVKEVLAEKKIIVIDDLKLQNIIGMVKERCIFMNDFYGQCVYFFEAPKDLDTESIKHKWTKEKFVFFEALITQMPSIEHFNMKNIEENFKVIATEKNIKIGELQLPLRIMLVGGKFGPSVFQIAEMIGKQETINRIQFALKNLTDNQL